MLAASLLSRGNSSMYSTDLGWDRRCFIHRVLLPGQEGAPEAFVLPKAAKDVSQMHRAPLADQGLMQKALQFLQQVSHRRKRPTQLADSVIAM